MIRTPLVIFIGIVLCGQIHGQSDSSWVTPERVSLRGQFAGQQGMVSFGGLLNLEHDRIQFGIMYGFAPGEIETPDFHGITLRSTWALPALVISKQKNIDLSVYASVSAMLEVGGISFFTVPEGFPERYYFPQSLHGIFGGGIKLRFKGLDAPCSLSVETVSLDTHLWYLISQKQVHFLDAWSLSLGLEIFPFK